MALPRFLPAPADVLEGNTGKMSRPWMLFFQALLDQASSGGSGDVVGPGSALDNQIVLFDGTTGKLIKGASGVGVVHAIAPGGVYDVGDVLLSEIEPASAGSLLIGRGDSGAGDWQEIDLGSGLSMSGTTLSAQGAGVPYYVPPGETFTIPVNIQGLWTMPITVDGDLVVDGFLVEVD